ncbi:hypothetical protein H6P81_005727 [Aristolochia fimbriata]|uniref:Apple domain-containing protein n=1 Tax=Aristolochia fimbriata TaxID=158543 RepID=A0AAV7EZU0_ARIFI|nr:hypothetical protein H6P81_005727 [Aristolochia fimbriata]
MVQERVTEARSHRLGRKQRHPYYGFFFGVYLLPERKPRHHRRRNQYNHLVNSTAILTDTGNLLLLSDTTRETVWQSFDHPGSAFIPNMKIGIDLTANRPRFLRSWKSPWDPSVGNFSLGISSVKPYQVLIWSNSEIYWRSGPWNSRIFLGVPGMNSNYLNGFSIAEEAGSINFIYAAFSDSESNQTLLSLNSTGILEQLDWDEEKREWFTSLSVPGSECDDFGKCGPSGVCDPTSSPPCSCLRGFEPKFREDWNRGNWFGGCVRSNPLSCATNGSASGTAKNKGDGFVKLEKMKPPDSIASLSFDGAEGCEGVCLRNCFCVAYAYDVGIGCMFWSGDLIDLQKFPVSGVDLYIRLPVSEIGHILSLSLLLNEKIGFALFFSLKTDANAK